jgi:polar amino acid transport system substrate-binding protein
VYGDMLATLRSGAVDAVVDDDAVFVPLAGSA